jgi:hypothetical protein
LEKDKEELVIETKRSKLDLERSIATKREKRDLGIRAFLKEGNKLKGSKC